MKKGKDTTKNYNDGMPVKYQAVIDQVYDPNNDLYELLELSPDSSTEEIHNKFKDAITKLTNDVRNGNTYAKKTLNMVQDGYIIMRDSRLKEAYDNARNDYINGVSHPTTLNGEVIKVDGVEESEEARKAANKGLIILGTVAAGALAAAIIYAIASSKKADALQVATISDNNASDDVIEEQIEEIVYDVEEYNVNYFDDANDEEKINARATAIYNALVASNVYDVSIEELENQIKFINGSYAAVTDMDAYDMANDVLETFAEYGTAVAQAANFAGGVVSENGVEQSILLSAFCLDNCEHKEFMDEASVLFVNVLTADTEEDKRIASIEFLKQQSDLQLGLLVDETGTKLTYYSLDNNEGFVYGIMSHITAPVIKSALGENYTIPYEANNDNTVTNSIKSVLEYYNPQCDNGEYNTENVWNEYLTELVIRATLNKSEGYTLTLSSEEE